MSQTISIRYLREHLAAALRRVSSGEQLIVTRRGKPVARIVPERKEALQQGTKHPLRGSVLRMAKDFDRPIDGLWKALNP